jgi:glycerol kinase
MTYQSKDLLDVMEEEANTKIVALKVDGGASENKFLLQFQSDILQINVVKGQFSETTALGAAYMAGLAVGFWKDFDEIERVREVDRIFVPTIDGETKDTMLAGWHKAVERSRDWEK